MKQFNSQIISNVQIAKDLFHLEFLWDKKNGTPLPGNFLTIRISPNSIPLLRRPFALSSFDRNKAKASILYQKRGIATEILSGKSTGDNLDIIGPLGNSFSIKKSVSTIIAVAGGIGIGPILFAASTLQSNGKTNFLIIGARSSEYLPEKKYWSLLGFEPVISTDDGSTGMKGTVLDVLKTIETNHCANAEIFSCGPLPMLKACHEFAAGRGILCKVSMEQTMACGVGACMGCVIKTVHAPGFARVCKDGPIFDSRDILWT